MERLLVEDLYLYMFRKPQTWPESMRLNFIETGMRTLDMQGWIHKHKASVARIQCSSNKGKVGFDKLVESLREGQCVSC